MIQRKCFLTFIAAGACTVISTKAAVVFFDSFPGESSAFLNGTAPSINQLGTNPLAAWSSTTTGDTIFQADGTVVSTTGQNTDRGAWLDLGAGFMQANTTYTITLDFSNVSNSIVYFGFQNTTAPNLGIRGQDQGTLTVGGAIRNFSTRQEYNLLAGDAVETVSNLPYSATGTLTAVIQSNSLTDATVTVGNQTANFDATSLRHFMFGFEDGSTVASGVILNSITIDAVPEPSIALLGALGMLGLLRRRR